MLIIKRNMKLQRYSKAVLVSALFVLFSFVATAGNMDNIKSGFKQANVKAISAYFASSVDITFLDQKSTVGGVQAELVLSNFFDKNSVMSFEINFSGSDSANNEYAIGEYKSINGTYSIYITLNGMKQISELKFEKK